MSKEESKLLSLKEAVARYVFDGAHISIGGFTLNRNPMAAVYEIIRQGRKKLHMYAHSNGQGVDELIGGGCVARLEIAYGGSGRFAPTCVRFRKAVENGSLLVEDYSNYQMTLRFMAGAMGVPFLPCRSGLGSDIINRWGFSESMRKSDARLPDEKMVVMDNPFNGWAETNRVVLLSPSGESEELPLMSKEAVAHYPEIIKEMKLALQEAGRRLGKHIKRRAREADAAKKQSYIQKYIPHIGEALQEILAISDGEKEEIITTLTDTLERSRKL